MTAKPGRVEPFLGSFSRTSVRQTCQSSPLLLPFVLGNLGLLAWTGVFLRVLTVGRINLRFAGPSVHAQGRLTWSCDPQRPDLWTLEPEGASDASVHEWSCLGLSVFLVPCVGTLISAVHVLSLVPPA